MQTLEKTKFAVGFVNAASQAREVRLRKEIEALKEKDESVQKAELM
jgi:hypothetical protein